MAAKKSSNGTGAKILAAGIAALVMAGGAKHHGHGILATLTSIHVPGASAASAGGSAGCRKLERLWMAAGGNPAQAETAAAIAMAESSGEQYSTDDDGNGTVDRGYWQINSIHGAQSTFDPMGNARAAVAISGDGTNWTPWVTYQTQAYVGKC